MTDVKDSKPGKKLGRRRFLRAAGATGAAGLVASCGDGGGSDDAPAGGGPAILSKQRNLRMVTTWPKNAPGMGVSAERLAGRIREATEGRIDIRVYGAGELVPALGAFDAVSQGNADIYHGAEYYWQGKSPAFNFFAGVPFGMTSNEMFAWIHHDGGQELWDQLAARFNIKPLLGGSTGPQMGGWYRSEMNSLDDFRGLRIRIPGLGGDLMRRIGATPVTKAGGEIFLALSQGNIDATEWIGPWIDMVFGFHTIAKNYYYPGIHEPGTALGVGFNKDLWDDLSPPEKSIVEGACLAETHYSFAEFNAQNAHALVTLVEEHGVNVRRFSDDILAALAEVNRDVLAEVATDDFTVEVLQSFTGSLQRQAAWGDISEVAFADARRLARSS